MVIGIGRAYPENPYTLVFGNVKERNGEIIRAETHKDMLESTRIKPKYYLTIEVRDMTVDVSTILHRFSPGVVVTADIGAMTLDDIVQLRDMLSLEIEKLNTSQ